MIRNVFVAVLVLLICEINCFSQSKSEQIRQLQKIATQNEERAKKAEEEAEKYNRIAQAAQSEAERMRGLAIASAISRKSLEIEDKNLAALLAIQAYNFNFKYKGYEYDNDIYQGLITALNNFNQSYAKLTGSSQPVRSLITKRSTSTVISLAIDGSVLTWTKQNDEWQGKELIPPRIGYDVYAVDISASRPWVIGSKKSGNAVGVYDLTYSSKKIEGFTSEVAQVNFIPEAKGFYALNNSGQSIFFSDLNNAQEVIQSIEKIVLMDLSRDGSKLAGVTAEGNLNVWDVKNQYSVSSYKIGSSESRITSISFTPSGRDIVVGSEKGEIKIVSAANGIVRKTLAGRYSQIEKIVFSATDRFMAVHDKANVIRVFNMGDLNRWPQVIQENELIGGLAFSPDDVQIFCSAKEKDRSIHVWSLKLENLVKELTGFINRNMTRDEWDSYVGDVAYEATCPNLPKNDK